MSPRASLDLHQLAQFQFAPQLQAWAFPVLFLGFAVLAGIWPLHTWAPTGHVAAPTAGSMLLAGIVMKLGAYGATARRDESFPARFPRVEQLDRCSRRHRNSFMPRQWRLRQRDLKFVIGYSSVSHMGFVLLGLATANALGVSRRGAANVFARRDRALLFAVAGRMIYRRTHTRELDALSE